MISFELMKGPHRWSAQWHDLGNAQMADYQQRMNVVGIESSHVGPSSANLHFVIPARL